MLEIRLVEARELLDWFTRCHQGQWRERPPARFMGPLWRQRTIGTTEGGPKPTARALPEPTECSPPNKSERRNRTDDRSLATQLTEG
jgi:hypothetical protein